MVISETKKYFAFISYSHKDSELAKWLQHEFEYYELPAKLFEEHKELNKEDFPEYFRPVFRDEDELAGGELKPQISKALADSEYLIVVCSPHSAQSKYVDNEIKEFVGLSQGNKRRIFPFIVYGKPHQDEKHKENECFPKTLLELSEDKIDPVELIAGDIDIHATGRDHAFVKVLAGMLREKQISFSDLWDRYALDKAEKERKEREEKEKLQIAQSRFVTEKAEKLIEEGDYSLAKRLMLEIVPSNIKYPNRPYTGESDAFLRKIFHHDCGILRGHKSSVYYLATTAKGDRIISVSDDKTIRIWDTNSYKCIRAIEEKDGGHSAEVCKIAISFDSKHFVTASSDHTVRYWGTDTDDIKDCKLLNVHAEEKNVSSDGVVIISNIFDSLTIKDGYVYFKLLNGIIKRWKPESEQSATPVAEIKKNCASILYKYPENNQYDIVNGDLVYRNQIIPINCHKKYSHDGNKYIHFSPFENDVFVYDASTRKELCRLVGHTGWITSTDLSKDGKLIVTSSRDGSVKLWDSATGICVKTYLGHSVPVCYAIFSPDNKHIISAGEDRTIRLWEFHKQECVAVLRDDIVSDGQYCSVKYSKYKDLFVSGSKDRIVRVWNNKGAILKRIPGLNGGGLPVSISPNGRYIVFAGDSGIRHIQLNDDYSITELPASQYHTKGVLSIDFSSDGKMIVTASAGADNNLSLCNLPSLRILPLEGVMHGATVRCAQFSHNCKLIVSSSDDRSVKIWDVNRRICIKTISGFKENVNWASFSYDDKRIVVASGSLIFVYTAQGDYITTINDCPGHVECVSFSMEDKYIVAAAGSSTQLCTWDAETYDPIRVFRGHTGAVIAIDCNLRTGHVITASLDSTLRLWDTSIENCMESNTLICFSEHVKRMSISSDGQMIAAYLEDTTICVSDINGREINSWKTKRQVDELVFFYHNESSVWFILTTTIDSRQKMITHILWDIETGEALEPVSLPCKSIRKATADGRYSLITYDGGIVELCEGEDLKTIKTLVDSGSGRCLQALSPNSKMAATSSPKEQVVCLWDTSNGNLLHVLDGHEGVLGRFSSLSFSPNNKYLLAGLYDGTIQIWNVDDGVCLQEFEGHYSVVTSVYFLPDERHIVSSSFDKTIRIWDFPPLQELIDKTHERFKDNPLTPEERRHYYLE